MTWWWSKFVVVVAKCGGGPAVELLALVLSLSDVPVVVARQLPAKVVEVAVEGGGTTVVVVEGLDGGIA